MLTSVGFLGYQLFKSDANKQSSFYIERAGPSSPGGYDPKDPKEKNNNDDSQKYLNEALKRKGLDKAPNNLKEKWAGNGYDFEVRIHPAESKYGKEGNIYRVARRRQGFDANGQGYGWEYIDKNGKWHHTSTLRPQNPGYNEQAACDTHIQLS